MSTACRAYQLKLQARPRGKLKRPRSCRKPTMSNPIDTGANQWSSRPQTWSKRYRPSPPPMKDQVSLAIQTP
jgi:hypothetical protein